MSVLRNLGLTEYFLTFCANLMKLNRNLAPTTGSVKALCIMRMPVSFQENDSTLQNITELICVFNASSAWYSIHDIKLYGALLMACNGQKGILLPWVLWKRTYYQVGFSECALSKIWRQKLH